MAKDSRDQLLELLQRRKRATVDEMAQAVGLASATVRRHLDILQRDHLVTWDQVRRETGRPHYLYYLTDDGQERLPRHYDRLASLLLVVLTSLTPEEIAEHSGPELVNLALSRVGELLAQQHHHRMPEGNLEQRVGEVTRILCEESLTAEYVPDGDGFRIHCYNCPFLRVARAYPAVCLSHLEMIAALLHADVWRQECLASGDDRCTYVITDHRPD